MNIPNKNFGPVKNGFACGGCGFTFRSDSVFLQHRIGDPDHRICLNEQELREMGFVVNKFGQWVSQYKGPNENTRIENPSNG